MFICAGRLHPSFTLATIAGPSPPGVGRHRSGDGAELAIIELVDNARDKEAQSSGRKRAAKGASKKKSAETKAESASKDKEEGAGE